MTGAPSKSRTRVSASSGARSPRTPPRHQGTRARGRAEARQRRLRGEIGLKRSVALLLAAVLLLIGSLGGGLLGVYLDRSGHLDNVLDRVDLARSEATEARPARPSGKVAASLELPTKKSNPETKARPAAAVSVVNGEAPLRPIPQAPDAPPVPSKETASHQTNAIASDRAHAAAPIRLTGVDWQRLYEEPVKALDFTWRQDQRVVARVLKQAALAGLELEMAAPAAAQPWQRHAVAVADVGGRPMIAIVLDDLGLNRPNTWRAIGLPAPLTLSFMTYAENLDAMVAEARNDGHEILVHLPMEPSDPAFDPGPNVLLSALSRAELSRRVAWGLDRFEGYVGVNNHMGSRFTSSPAAMAQVLSELKSRGLLFLDSLTAGNSVGGTLARSLGVPYAERDVFLDHEDLSPSAIHGRLGELEAIARNKGYAVGIGHPHDATLAVLGEWLETAKARGFAIVPITAVVRHRIELARSNGGAG